MHLQSHGKNLLVMYQVKVSVRVRTRVGNRVGQFRDKYSLFVAERCRGRDVHGQIIHPAVHAIIMWLVLTVPQRCQYHWYPTDFHSLIHSFIHLFIYSFIITPYDNTLATRKT